METFKKYILLFLIVTTHAWGQKPEKGEEPNGKGISSDESGGYVQMENNGLRYKKGTTFKLYDGEGGDAYRYEFLSNGMIRNWGMANLFQFSQGVNESGDQEFISHGITYGTANTRMIIKKSTGNVGIGLVSPNNRLDINGRIRIRHNGESAGIWLGNDNNGLTNSDGAFIGMETTVAGSERAGFWIGNAWRFYIDRSGNTTNGGDLAVGGDLNVDGNTTQQGSMMINGGLSVVNGISVGTGETLVKVRKVSRTIASVTVSANGVSTTSVPVLGLAPNEHVLVTPTAGLLAYFSIDYAYTDTDKVWIRFRNHSDLSGTATNVVLNILTIR